MVRFEWDPAKAKSNFKKHSVSFEEARSVFYDELAIQFFDDDDKDEVRFILLGVSDQSRILVVVHCERGDKDDVLRLISARKATKNEQKFYQGERS